VQRAVAKPEVAARISSVVDDLDATIRDIRGAIFQLRAPVELSLRAEVRALVDAAAEPLAFRPSLTLDGLIDSAVPDDLRGGVLAVIREALSNVVRHAGAGKVEVKVSANARHVTVMISDDGKAARPKRAACAICANAPKHTAASVR
jgi:signal transduction histidine kinase